MGIKKKYSKPTIRKFVNSFAQSGGLGAKSGMGSCKVTFIKK